MNMKKLKFDFYDNLKIQNEKNHFLKNIRSVAPFSESIQCIKVLLGSQAYPKKLSRKGAEAQRIRKR